LELNTLPTLATFTEPRTRHACTERDTICPRDRKLAVAGITCLEWRVGLAPTSPAVALKPPPCGMPGCPSNSYGRCRPLHELRTARPLTLLSPFEPLLVAQSWPEGLEPFPHAMHQHHGFPDSETPSTHGSWWLTPRWRSERPPDNEQPQALHTRTCRSTRVYAQ